MAIFDIFGSFLCEVGLRNLYQVVQICPCPRYTEQSYPQKIKQF